ncbi:MAG: hypothetical protein IJH39_01875 [Clostridia bacterium]|nr:hypothetical protein [Clostridia bacterium]
MEREENRLFKFATKELSQDAFISWCINWFNYKEDVKGNKNKEKLCKMSEEILNKILSSKKISVKDIGKVDIVRQFENIDILVVVTLKNLEQYLIIIEDKVSASLSNHQRKDLYVTKLIKALENNKEKQYLLSLSNFNKDNIIPVFWKTSEWSEKKEDLKKELEKNIGKEVICINGNDTLEMLKEFTQCSDIVEDFYTCLQEYLRFNNQLPEDDYCVEKIIKNEKILEGTTFTKNYYAYNCFSNLIGKKYNGKSHPQTGGIVLNKLSKRILDEKILNNSNKLERRNNKENVIAVDTIRFFTFGTSYKNYLSVDNRIWTEEVEKKIVDKGEFYTNLRYIFLFARKLNPFRKEQYEFLGLYKLAKYDEKMNTRQWKKCELADNQIPLNEDEIIKVIKKLEK